MLQERCSNLLTPTLALYKNILPADGLVDCVARCALQSSPDPVKFANTGLVISKPLFAFCCCTYTHCIVCLVWQERVLRTSVNLPLSQFLLLELEFLVVRNPPICTGLSLTWSRKG